MARKLGIVGGTGPESTIDYYRALIAGWRRRNPDGSYPRVIINSVEAGRVIRWLAEDDLDAVGRELNAAVRELAAAGCGAALFASNAVHLAFAEATSAVPIPVIHIVEAAHAAAIAQGHRRMGLLGTRFIMGSSLYSRLFAPEIEIVTPTADEQAYVHTKYIEELLQGDVVDATRAQLVSIIAGMRSRDAIDGLILGGTELSLILDEARYADVPILDTARVHVEAALDWLLDETNP